MALLSPSAIDASNASSLDRYRDDALPSADLFRNSMAHPMIKSVQAWQARLTGCISSRSLFSKMRGINQPDVLHGCEENSDLCSTD
jgi:hypothetical protein